MPNTPVDKGGSTAHFKIPGSTSSISSDVASPAVPSSAPFYEELKELLWACGSDADQHQLVTIGIKACIAEGIDTKVSVV